MATRVGLVGATGAVGREILRCLEQRDFPCDDLRLFRSPGAEDAPLTFRDVPVTVRPLADPPFAGCDLVFLATSASVSRSLLPRVLRAGARAIDLSDAFRADAEVPLVVPEVNGSLLTANPQAVASPNCTTTLLVLALAALRPLAAPQRVVACSYQSVSGVGRAGMTTLRRETASWLATDEREGLDDTSTSPLLRDPTSPFPYPIAFHLFPRVGGSRVDGRTSEEWKLEVESRRMLGLPELRVAATCVRVPVFRVHSIAVHLEASSPLDPAMAAESFSAAKGLRFVAEDEPGDGPHAIPSWADGRDDVMVGRLRPDRVFEGGLAFWVVGDQLRKGAALNAVQIAECLVGRRGSEWTYERSRS